MRDIPALFVFIGSMTGILLGLLLCWQLLHAVLRLILAAHTTTAVSLLLHRLSAAVRAGRSWEPVLRGLRLEMPWPWPWRLGRAAERLAAGTPPAEMLTTSGLLPVSLRRQAAQALHQGPEAFGQWCDAVADRSPPQELAVRQQALLFAEGVALVGMLWFLSTFILPKFEQILRDINAVPPSMLQAFIAINPYMWPLLVGVVIFAAALWSLTLAAAWRRRRRFAAARLLLIGSLARLPESALGQAGGFAELCTAAGWQASGPEELAQRLAREEARQVLRGAWLPSLVAAIAPFIAAIPIGLVVIGIFQILISILTSLEGRS